MMNKFEIHSFLSELVSIREDESEIAMRLCDTSIREISAKLRADVDESDIRIISAASVLAYYKLMLRRCADESENNDEITSFKAGDVNITQSKSDSSKQLEYAKNLLDEKMLELTPLCKDNSFAFKNVEVKVKI